MLTLAVEKQETITPQSIAKVSAAQESKINALTSLRFFAAAMIFVGHSTALSPPNRPNYTDGLALWQGVSFFFVLSGFILAYVYPKIDSVADAGKFLLARFARIWPTHLVAFAVTLLLVPQCLHIPNVFTAAIINLCMLQVWSLDPLLAASFNKVSWTISVELFFYVCFPYMIKDFDKPFKTRWIIASLLSLSFVLLCLIPDFPGCGGYNFPESIFVGFNPLCRLLEFVLGIAICRAFTQGKLLAHMNYVTATALEIAALALVACAVLLPTFWPVSMTMTAMTTTITANPSQFAQVSSGGLAAALYTTRAWLLDMGGAPAYGALIFLMATQKGLISKFLSNKFFVGLGEISFSLYMFHLSIIFYLLKFQPSFANQPDWVMPVTAFVIALLVSHLNFTLIETPCRRAIMSRVKGRSKSTARIEQLPAGGPHLYSPKKQLWRTVVAEVCMLTGLVCWVQTQYRFIPPALAARVESHSVPNVRGVEFGAKFKLRGLKLTRSKDGLQINTIWQSLVPQKLTYVNALQLLNEKGMTVSSHDYLQDEFKRSASKGQIWEDKVFLSRTQLKGVTKIGLELYHPPESQPLTANSGSTDWDGRRLLISLE